MDPKDWQVTTLFARNGAGDKLGTPWGLSIDFVRDRLVIPDTSGAVVLCYYLSTVRLSSLSLSLQSSIYQYQSIRIGLEGLGARF